LFVSYRNGRQPDERHQMTFSTVASIKK